MTDLVKDAEFRRRMQEGVAALTKNTWFHSVELPDGRVIPGVVSVEALQTRIRRYPIPEDLTGKRLLDVGAATGWNSFEMERRGAQVVAVDCVDLPEFRMARDLLGSKVEYHVLDVEELNPRNLGRFDYVLFFGVLYHLRHPLLGLEKICALTHDTAFVESFVIDGDACSMEFYETDELGGQLDNWCGPTTKCLKALCRSAGFVRVQLEYSEQNRAGLTCHRKWDSCAEAKSTAPWVCSVVNNRTLEPRFHPPKDEYMCLYFRSDEVLDREQIRIELDGYGVPPLTLSNAGAGAWQANAKLPPGLDDGVHEVRIRTFTSPFSQSFSITVGGAAAIAPVVAADAVGPAPTWIAAENTLCGGNIFRGYKAEYLSCRFVATETSLRTSDIILELDGRVLPILVLANLGNGEWQINALLPNDWSPGRHEVRIQTAGGRFGEPVEIVYEPVTLGVIQPAK